jgi:hypothetical protein
MARPHRDQKVIAYSNFISRIIYDAKWYDQDINTIVNPVFQSNINAIIEFIVQNVFLRISAAIYSPLRTTWIRTARVPSTSSSSGKSSSRGQNSIDRAQSAVTIALHKVQAATGSDGHRGQWCGHPEELLQRNERELKNLRRRDRREPVRACIPATVVKSPTSWRSASAVGKWTQKTFGRCCLRSP